MLEFDCANVVDTPTCEPYGAKSVHGERGHDDGVAPDEWVAYEVRKGPPVLYENGNRGPDRNRILQCVLTANLICSRGLGHKATNQNVRSARFGRSKWTSRRNPR